MTHTRRYQDVARDLRKIIAERGVQVGDRLMTERQFSEDLGVSRSLVREALITLEIEGLVEVRKGSGIYLTKPQEIKTTAVARDDIGPFELLQARQLLESNIAGFAAQMVTPNDINRMHEALNLERQGIENEAGDLSGDEMFHHLIAEATQNSMLVATVEGLWSRRQKSPMWDRLHDRIFDMEYRRAWLDDHQTILKALQCKDATGAQKAMWQHLENVRETLMKLSDVDDAVFDGYMFQRVNTAS
ncbi:MAG: FCD domain-containing protein [Marinosulfonomonas sp.]|nr:FCD domain-containing protein [Marinosulfonomonas sp.]